VVESLNDVRLRVLEDSGMILFMPELKHSWLGYLRVCIASKVLDALPEKKQRYIKQKIPDEFQITDATKRPFIHYPV
jgi:hypothetical protein